jgi:predicted enzyme related to lactoylglutathione lyase
MAGEIVHLELPSRNFERSAAFYGKLFGWRAGPAQSGGHLRFETSPEGAGGDPSGPGEGGVPQVSGSFILSAIAQSPGPLPFIAVDDVSRTLAEAEQQGGRILVARQQLAGLGEFGLLADLDGNVIAVLAGAGTPPPPVRRPGAGAEISSEPVAAPEPGEAATARAAGDERTRPIGKGKSGDSPKKPGPVGRGPTGKGPAKPGPARKR